jgi:hypothetical protein
MYLGLGLRLGSGTFAGFDADAAAYFDRAGVTDATAKSQINAFVKGVKALGLWSSMVSWPLRSAQNAGTGTTAYSLGGLGIYDGTLSLSPNGFTWALEGLTALTTSSIITTSLSLNTGNSSRSIFAAWQNLSASQFLPIGTTDSDLNRFLLRSNNTTNACADLYDGSTNDTFGSTAVPSGINFSAASYNNSNSTVIFKANSNTASTGTIARNFASHTVRLGAYNSGGQGLGLYSMAGVFDLVALTELQINNLRDLYKATLGTGLGLP